MLKDSLKDKNKMIEIFDKEIKNPNSSLQKISESIFSNTDKSINTEPCKTYFILNIMIF